MNIKKTLVVGLSATTTMALMLSGPVMANSATDLVNKAVNAGKDALYADAPDWLQRTSVELQIEEGFKPTIELETVQPILQNSDNDMLFYQLNARHRNSEQSYNLGLGYRNIASDKIMYGANLFYDYAAEHGHKRSSLGLEAISNIYEVRANVYNAISGKKTIKTNEFEQALDGWDVEVGGSILPSDRNLKVYLSHAQFDAVSAGRSDYKDNQVRLTYPLNNNTLLELGHTMEKEKYSDKDKNRSFAKLKYTFGKVDNTKSLPSSGLRSKLLQAVERRHEIVLEKTIQASVTVSRGN